jgi:transcriptional regulator with XRE-family HTH domain
MSQESLVQVEKLHTEGTTALHSRLGAYLRRLREGYGYTLRKVEERADTLGESIDNSQLSRFEKGKAVPSFDKLRALARIFNIPVQIFSDVLDLEEYEPFKPSESDFGTLMATCRKLESRGEFGRAFVHFERSLEVAAEGDAGPELNQAIGEARVRMAIALKCLGKLSMAEQEFREILKATKAIIPHTRMSAVLQLSFLYREQGDLILSSILAKEALTLSREVQNPLTEVAVWNTLANIADAEDDFEGAVVKYKQSLELLRKVGGKREMETTVSVNLGGSMVKAGQHAAGMEVLHRALNEARRNGYRRAAALAFSELGESYHYLGDTKQAMVCFSESDVFSTRGNSRYHDLLFQNAYRRWEIARAERNGTKEKIAFGRLRHLRALLQGRFPEVDAFDTYIDLHRRPYDIAK